MIRSARFVCSAVAPDQYPPVDVPEVAFAGRSNVGKSSLINRLVNRRKLVRISKTPGRTQTLNFYEINESWRFVDLPGYGYARVPPAVRRRWRPMVEAYLSARPNMRGLVLLLDIRRQPSAADLHLWRWLQARRVQVIVVLTKADKLSKNQRQRQAASIAVALGCDSGRLLPFSATTGEGRRQLWQALLPLLESKGS